MTIAIGEKVKTWNTQLTEAGIDIQFHDPGEVDRDDVFEIELNDDRLGGTMIPGAAAISVYADKDYRQAVIRVFEGKRTLTRTFDRRTSVFSGETKEQKVEALGRDLARGYWFPVALPQDRTFYVATEVKLKAGQRWPKFPEGHDITFEVTVAATVEASDQCFLIGHDDSHMFVSLLPQTVKSVKRAHDVLRPKGVPEGSVRQGEFFFVPVSEAKSDELDAEIQKNPWDCMGAEALFKPNGDNENHLALTYLSKNEGGENVEYAIGIIVDQEGRHPMLFLEDWCRVYPNTELESSNGLNWD